MIRSMCFRFVRVFYNRSESVPKVQINVQSSSQWFKISTWQFGNVVNMSSSAVKIGIIGGSGLHNPNILKEQTEREVDTPYGKPSDHLKFGKINGVDCVILPRHDRQHTIMPTNINYQANIWALKEAGCTHVISTNACGSLQENYHPGDFVFPDQFIDRTTKRPSTLYDGQTGHPPGICHLAMHEPFCEPLRQVLIETAQSLGYSHHAKGTVIVVEGPRFSSKAESKLFQSWGCDIIGMTLVPEVCLAKEAGLLYASICMITDYDCWKHQDHAMVNVESVTQVFKENVEKVLNLVMTSISKIVKKNWDSETEKIEKTKNENLMLPADE